MEEDQRCDGNRTDLRQGRYSREGWGSMDFVGDSLVIQYLTVLPH